jgi:chromate transport protein ChrA
MYALSLGVSQIGDTLPAPVYALLSGLNAATVGIIALAAVQLAQNVITDKVTRVLVFLSGAAGMLYTALWYFPILMLGAGSVTIVWDFRWLHRIFKPFYRGLRAFIRTSQEGPMIRHDPRAGQPTDLSATPVQTDHDIEMSIPVRRVTVVDERDVALGLDAPPATAEPRNPVGELQPAYRIIPPSNQLRHLTWKAGVCIITGFFFSFVTIMTIRGLLKTTPRGVSLFSNLYLAGTIIFGGGPVVIPLLREYIVAEGWVSPRDFLLGLAIIQSFPGPNFNFAVYLGSLAAAGSSLPSFVGAMIGFLGIFTPGIIIVIGVMGLWNSLRSRRWLLSLLRGVNAGAVGLVFTAVYKLWQIGFVDADNQSGSPLGRDPWWVAITAMSFVGGAWFGLSAPFAILLGGALGMTWYGVARP